MTVISAPHFCKYTAFRGLINLCSTTHSLAMSFRHFFFLRIKSIAECHVIRAFRLWRMFSCPKKHASDVAVQYKLVSVNVLFVVNKLFIFSHYPPVCSSKHKVLAECLVQSAGAIFYKDWFRAYACVRTEIAALKSPFIVPRRENEKSLWYGYIFIERVPDRLDEKQCIFCLLLSSGLQKAFTKSESLLEPRGKK